MHMAHRRQRRLLKHHGAAPLLKVIGDNCMPIGTCLPSNSETTNLTTSVTRSDIPDCGTSRPIPQPHGKQARAVSHALWTILIRHQALNTSLFRPCAHARLYYRKQTRAANYEFWTNTSPNASQVVRHIGLAVYLRLQIALVVDVA